MEGCNTFNLEMITAFNTATDLNKYTAVTSSRAFLSDQHGSFLFSTELSFQSCIVTFAEQAICNIKN